MIKFLGAFAVLVLSSVSAWGGGHKDGKHTADDARADHTVVSQFQLSKITCGELLGLKDAHRDYVFFVLYGYVAGSKGQDTQSLQRISQQVQHTSDTCSEMPGAHVMDVLMSASSKGRHQ